MKKIMVILLLGLFILMSGCGSQADDTTEEVPEEVPMTDSELSLQHRMETHPEVVMYVTAVAMLTRATPNDVKVNLSFQPYEQSTITQIDVNVYRVEGMLQYGNSRVGNTLIKYTMIMAYENNEVLCKSIDIIDVTDQIP